MPNQFIEKDSIVYTSCELRGAGGGEGMEEGRQRAKSDSVGRENTGCHRHSCPGLIITALQGRKPGSQELKP